MVTRNTAPPFTDLALLCEHFVDAADRYRPPPPAAVAPSPGNYLATSYPPRMAIPTLRRKIALLLRGASQLLVNC